MPRSVRDRIHSASQLMSRRELLMGAGALGLLVGLPTGRLALGVDQAYAAAAKADWVDLSRSLKGSLLMPDSPDYPVARLAFNTIYDNVYPQAVLLAADASDVQKAIAFCQDMGVRPVARSGGHSFQGFSTGTGLIIDVSRLNRVQLRADRERASIGAGAQLIDIYARLFTPHRMAIPGGTCPLVGISGLTQGGGIGPFSRQYGLTLDRLLGAWIVTADGRRRWVDAGNEPDLFWAIRGGGGGSFGIVTSFTFAPVPADMTLNNVTLTFAWRDAARVLAAFQEWPEVLPRTAYPSLVLGTSNRAPDAQPTVTVTLWDRGPRKKVDAAVRAFIREVGAQPLTRTLMRQNFFEAEYDEYCQGLTWTQCGPVTRPGGTLPRGGRATYSEISTDPWPAAANDVLVEELERWQQDPMLQPDGVPYTLQAGKVIIEPLSGAVHDTAASATAFPHRSGWLVYQFQSRVRPDAPAEVVAAGQEWVSNLYARLSPWRTGAEYSNYGNRMLANWAQAYYAGNLPRLREIKAQVDPKHLFHFEQSIRPKASTRG